MTSATAATMSTLPAAPSKRHRRPLPTGRVFFSDLSTYLGLSAATVKRRYRPADDAARAEWAERLDIRERPGDGALHCSAERVAELRCELDAETLEGPLATARSERARRLEHEARACPACGYRLRMKSARYCAECGVQLPTRDRA